MSNEIQNLDFLQFFTITVDYYYTKLFTDQVYCNTSMYFSDWCFLAAEQNHADPMSKLCLIHLEYLFTNMQTRDLAW